jgi:hypothetical protein
VIHKSGVVAGGIQMPRRHLVVAAFVVALAMPITAMAFTQQGQQMMNNWKGADRCNAAARKAFPDYTAESNAKRDAALKQCLSGQILPPHSDLDATVPKP